MTLSKLKQCVTILENRPDLQDLILRIDKAPPPGTNLDMQDPGDLWRIVSPHLLGQEYERVVAVALDDAWNLIDCEVLTKGNTRRAVFDIGMIVRWATSRIRPTAYLAIAHNHPGTNRPWPSSDDVDRTHELADVCQKLGIPLLDHLILADDGFYSFACDGEIPETAANVSYVRCNIES